MTEAKDLQLIFHILKYCERIKKVITFLDNDFNNYIDKKNFTSLDSCSFSAFSNRRTCWKTFRRIEK